MLSKSDLDDTVNAVAFHVNAKASRKNYSI